ncbi:MAG: hypothetical protein A2Y40_10800 [Candidatus Margulisbacteria bacterium GWF2_35_9]|nr:MAG: hypothetical protein A2Y40_10800 [Candidatus Margulisbacteria bacterium GWF2_35_9]
MINYLKDPLSGLLHLIGLFLAIPAMVTLIIIGHHSVWKIVSFSIYGSALVLLFLASTLHHWLPKKWGGKQQVFRKFDHLMIYITIAATYTPFCLLTLRGAWGWSIFGVIWTVTVIAVIFQSVFIDLPRWLTTTVYVLMGWLVLISIVPLVRNLAPGGLLFLLLGGIVYSIGGLIYTIKKPNLHPLFGFHELWHVFVLVGTICHFLALLLFVAI